MVLEPVGSRAAVLVVDDDPAALAATETQLTRRYGADYDVQAHGSVDEGLHAVQALTAEGRALAVALADLRLPSMSGVEFLARVHARSPSAKRVLLVERADLAAFKSEIATAAALRSVDCHLRKPREAPDEQRTRNVRVAVLDLIMPSFAPDGLLEGDELARRTMTQLGAEIGGLDLVRRLRQWSPGTAVVVWSAIADGHEDELRQISPDIRICHKFDDHRRVAAAVAAAMGQS